MKIKGIHKPEWESVKRRWNIGNISWGVYPPVRRSSRSRCVYTPTRGVAKVTLLAHEYWYKELRERYERIFRAKSRAFVYAETQRALLELAEEKENPI